MRALFTSKNLIGDAMNIYPALKQWHDMFPDAEIDFQTLPDHVVTIYKHMGIPMRIIFDDSERADKYDVVHNFDCGIAFGLGDRYKTHIAIAYAMALGVEIKSENYHLRYEPPCEPPLEPYEKDLIILSPFSRSCQSREGKPPNKMLKWETWQPIVRWARQFGSIGVVGAFDDRAPELEFTEDEYFTGLSIERVAHILRASKFVITIDNGISHLAASQQARMMLFYPACLGTHWIRPIGNKNLAQTVHLDPVTVQATDLVLALKKQLPKLVIAN